jgi:hypothetical protein
VQSAGAASRERPLVGLAVIERQAISGRRRAMSFGRHAMSRYPVDLADPLEEGHCRILDRRRVVVGTRRRCTRRGCSGSGYRQCL